LVKNAQRSKTVKVGSSGYANESLTHQPVNYLLAEAAARGGLPLVHPHLLRHSCGLSLPNRGHDLQLIQDYLGHRDPKHTVHYPCVAGRFEGLWR
jgi:type 1 fimbriae regulatory protein FimB